MKNLLKDLYTSAEGIKGPKLLVVLALTFVLFLAFGVSLRYFTTKLLNNNEMNPAQAPNGTQAQTVTLEGIISYLDPRQNPEDEVSYHLTETNGKRVVLLSADDQKLEVAEGLYAKVTGTIEKTPTGKDVLVVDKIVVRN